MRSITTEIAEVLSTVRRPGDFFASGTIEILAPRLEVDGIGPISLPLLPLQAEQLIAIAEPAPYGRGAETLVDPKVRRTWQISADRVRTGGKHWARTLQAILERVAAGLGVSEPISAQLYKLLVYDQGSFFVSHRDTEKVPGMFATLVVTLASASTGGELIIRHKGREVRLDLRSDEPSEAAFAAFYADCVHEVLPVTSGCRLALVYNLLRKQKGRKLEPPSYEDEQGCVVALLRKWAASKPENNLPDKLIYPLEHAYTPAELGFDKLKGADAAVAGLLVAAAPKAGCDLHLALVSIEESGIADYADGYGSRRGRWSEEEEFEAVEVCDRDASLSEWRRPDGNPLALGKLPIKEEEICPPDALEDMDPDEEHFHEATGNEGASFERTYRRAALVLWPSDRMFSVLNQAGLSCTLPYLHDLTERWITSKVDQHSVLWRQAHELAGRMLSTWPKQEWYSAEDEGPTEVARMLALLTRLNDTEHICAFLASVVAGGCHQKVDNKAILDALRLLSPGEAAGLLTHVVTGAATASLDACGDLLARAVSAFPDNRSDLVGAATALVEALPGGASRAKPRESWQRQPGRLKPGFVVDLFTGLAAVDESLAQLAADHVLAWPRTYEFDTILLPAMRQMIGSEILKNCQAVQRLRLACLEHLRTRVAEPLQAPQDWRRASKLGCRCPDCAELSRFLADPKRSMWIFKAAEAARGHLQETIQKAQCDLELTTDRRGRPYSLICTKNQASYERRVKQRKQDLADLESFERLPERLVS